MKRKAEGYDGYPGGPPPPGPTSYGVGDPRGPPPGGYVSTPHDAGFYPPPKRGPVGPPFGPPPGAGVSGGGYGPPPGHGPRPMAGPPPPGRPPVHLGAAGPGLPGNQLDLPPEPNILQQIFVHRRLVGKIIGPGGETATAIRKAAHCYLHVRKENRPDEAQIVEISGNASQVQAGIRRVLELVREEVAQDAKLEPRVAAAATTYFDVLPAMIGYVLGTRGATVKTLRQKTQTDIQVTDASPETGLQAITIRGTPERVQDAYAQIRSMLEKYDPRRGKGPPPGLLSGPPPRGPPPALPGPHLMPPGLPHRPGYDGPPRYGPPPGAPMMAPGGPPIPRYDSPARDDYYRARPPEYPPTAYAGREPSPPTDRLPESGALAATGVPPHAAAANPGAGAAGQPQVLVLHSDGVYRPASVVMGSNSGAGSAPQQAASTAAQAQGAAGAQAANPGLAALSQLLAQVAAGGQGGAAQMLAQQLLAHTAGAAAAPPQQQAAAPAAAASAAVQQQQQPAYAYPQQSAPAAVTYAPSSSAQNVANAPPNPAAPYQPPPASAPYPAAYASYAPQPQPQAAAPAYSAPAAYDPQAAAAQGMSLQQLQAYYSQYAALYQSMGSQQQAAAAAAAASASSQQPQQAPGANSGAPPPSG